MAVSMADIQKLRAKTSAGMMDCKNALNEAEGDFDKAVEIIRKKGKAFAAKRGDRATSEGCVLAGIKGDYSAIVCLNCETDFVAINADFVALTRSILDAGLNNMPKTVEELKALTIGDRTVEELVTERMGVTGEKMEVSFYGTVTAPSVYAYIHPGNKLAAIVGFNKPNVDAEMAKSVAMQIAAMNPVAVSPSDVSAEVKEKEMNLAREKAREAGKPEGIIEKIAEGALNKFYKDFTLLQQDFIKDNKMTVEKYIKSFDKDLGVVAFERYSLNAE